MGDPGTSRELARELDRRVEAIRGDLRHGATQLGRQALGVMAMAAASLASREGVVHLLNELAQRLALAQPSMAAVKNLTSWFVSEIVSNDKGLDPHMLERELLDAVDEACRKAAKGASEVVYEGARVITCSHSSAVRRTFEAAVASGRAFRVLAVESGADDMAYGRRVVEDASALGVAAELVSDDEIPGGVSNADLVLVGADKLLPDGGIVNGRPTLQLAQEARGAIPFYVVGESFKRDGDPYAEPAYDLVAPHLITQVFTDSVFV